METLAQQNNTFRILVVEDDSEMRGLLADMLAEEGYAVDQSGDGQDAISKLSRGHFDVIIADIIMPKTGGLEILSAVKRDFPDIPVILITAFGDAHTRARASEQGAFDYLCKPFRTGDLKGVVERAIYKVRNKNGSKSSL